MRGFGAVQTCFAHESQMDRLAAELGIDPVELRLRNALETGDTLITGQRIHGTAPVREVILGAASHPLPPLPDPADVMLPCPAGRAGRPTGTRFGGGRVRLRLQEPDVQRGLRRLRPPRARSGPTAWRW